MRKSNYDKRPVLHVRTKGVSAWQGWEAIGAQLRKAIAGKPDAVVCVDCYHGVWESDVLSALTEQLNPSRVFCTAQATLPKEQVNAMLKDHLTDDRVFGIMAHYRIEQFFDMERVAVLRQEIALAHGVRLVFGVGAALLCEHPDVLVYADMARWEIRLRFRSGKLANWLNDNYGEDPLRKYKRGYFIEWRVLDRHKRTLHSHIDYLLDTNDAETPRMMSGDCYRDALKQAVTQPFRVAPYFDPGVWGGQWMKSVCGLDPEKPNYAWSFDGVPEENSLLLDVDGIVVETPAINLVHEEAKALLGDKVHARFGTEFPIRFDFLDTIGGGNLSLQVHPLTEYIQDTFGMHYTQDESYYIVATGQDARTYLGFRGDADADEFVSEIKKSEQEHTPVDYKKYIYGVRSEPGVQVMIPAGTIHASGQNQLILEIGSLTVGSYTYKMYDYLRRDLDGNPRPIHSYFGSLNLNRDMKEDYVRANLVNGRRRVLRSGEDWEELVVGECDQLYFSLRNLKFVDGMEDNTDGDFHVLALVDGESITVRSKKDPSLHFDMNYLDMVVVPASMGEYELINNKPGTWITVHKTLLKR